MRFKATVSNLERKQEVEGGMYERKLIEMKYFERCGNRKGESEEKGEGAERGVG